MMSSPSYLPCPAVKPFQENVIETYRGIKDDFVTKPDVDPQVREQVNSDLDKIMDHHAGKKEWPLRSD